MAFTPVHKERVLSRQVPPGQHARGRAGETVQQQPPQQPTETLAESFQQYFSAELSHTTEQLLAVYNVRYRVYCEEFAYEPAQSFTDREEKDEFDGHSLHCLMRHRSSEQPAGCVRVVAPDQSQLTPMEKYCMDSIDPAFHKYLYDDRERMCEFSRLAVDAAPATKRSAPHTSRPKPQSVYIKSSITVLFDIRWIGRKKRIIIHNQSGGELVLQSLPRSTGL